MANNNHFELTLDTLAPSAVLNRPAQYIKENKPLTFSDVTGDPVFMKVWFNTNATGSKEDVGYTSGSWVNYSASKTTEFLTDGTYYYHAVLMDDVANESDVLNTETIVFDTVRPVVSTAYMADPVTHSREITNKKNGIDYGFEFGLDTSGVVKARISGDDLDEDIIIESPISPHTGTLDFSSDVEDGTKTITVYVTDAAGNESVGLATNITLNTDVSKPTLILKKDSETTLPEYINYKAIKAQLTCSDEDIVGYKIWLTGDEEPEYTTVTEGALDVIVDITLSDANGIKTVNAKVIDKAGTEAAADAKSVILDTVKPSVTLATNKTIISRVEGYTTATLTIKATDTLSGVNNWTLYCGSTSISTGTGELNSTFALTAANSMQEGENSIKLVATDNAGNNITSDLIIVILDTTAPTISLADLATWYNAHFDITTTYADTNGLSILYAWVSTVEDDEVVPASAQGIPPTLSPQVISANVIYWPDDIPESATNYMHVKAVDKVGNVSYATKPFGYDSVAPTKPVVSFEETIYTTTAALIIISSTDATSGITKMRVAGDIVNPTSEGEWEDYASSRSVVLSSTEGIKSVTVLVKDNAGNISELSDAATCELDTSTPTGKLFLCEADGTTAKQSVSSVAALSAQVGYTGDDAVGGVQYKIYGDFNFESQQTTGITEEEAEWTDLVFDTGKTYKLVSNMFCTSGDGMKKVYIQVKDNAGHTSAVVYQEFEYSTAAPIVVVGQPDYNRVSKIHAYRRSSSGELEAYADEVKFTFTPNHKVQAYKVCAYLDAEAAAAGSHEDAPIPITAGSTHMSDTGIVIQADEDFNCLIKGADYEAALIEGKESIDGAHIVVVYVQDMAGNWSVAASFSA